MQRYHTSGGASIVWLVLEHLGALCTPRASPQQAHGKAGVDHSRSPTLQAQRIFLEALLCAGVSLRPHPDSHWGQLVVETRTELSGSGVTGPSSSEW